MTINLLCVCLQLLLMRISHSHDFLFVSTKTAIRYFNIADLDAPGTYIPLENVNYAVALNYDPLKNFLYWIDKDDGTLSRANINGTDQQIILANVSTVGDLTLDWVSRVMYWTDTTNNVIEWSYLNGTGREVFINEDLDKPTAICVNTDERKLYWTETGANPRIMRVDLKSRRRVVLVSTSLVLPSVLALDLAKGVLFWGDEGLRKFMSADLDGNNPKLLYDSSFQPSAVDVHGGYLYWGDTDVRMVKRIISAQYSDNSEAVLSLPTEEIFHIRAIRLDDGRRILLTASESSIRYYDLKTEMGIGKKVIVADTWTPFGVDCDSKNGRIYITSGSTIRSVFLDGSDVKIVVNTNLMSASEIVVDGKAGLIFWLDTSKQTIERATLLGSERFTLLSGVSGLFTLEIDRVNAYIYWISFDAPGHLGQMDFNGRNQLLLAHQLARPLAIAIDVAEDRLYLSRKPKIEEAFFNGSIIRQVLNNVFVRSLAMSDGFLYCDTYLEFIWSINIVTNERKTLRDPDDNFVGITTQAIDDCASLPCQNDGMCIDVFPGYSCQCMDGSIGKNCEIEVNECASNPCKNDATCVDMMNGYQCQCVSGFVGKQCELGLGFIVPIAVVVLGVVFGIYIWRKESQRKKMTALKQQNNSRMHSLISLPSVGRSHPGQYYTYY